MGKGSSLGADQRLDVISNAIRVIPDFPKPGIQFQDVTTILTDPVAFKHSIDLLAERYRAPEHRIDVVAGFEARGLVFGAPLAIALGCAFVPLRKPGKLPGEGGCQSHTRLGSCTDRHQLSPSGALQAPPSLLTT